MTIKAEIIKRTFWSAALVCLVGISVGIGIVLADLHRLIHEWGQVDVQAIAQHLDEGVQKGTAAAAGVASVVQFERDSQQHQNDQMTHAMREFLKTAGDAHDLVGHLDRNLNGSPGTVNLPPVKGILPAAEEAVEKAGASIDILTTAAKSTLDAGTTAIATLNQRLADEHLASFMVNMDAASAGFAQTSVHLAGATGDIETKVHQLTRPASFAKNVGMTILDIGSKIGEVLSGFLKF